MGVYWKVLYKFKVKKVFFGDFLKKKKLMLFSTIKYSKSIESNEEGYIQHERKTIWGISQQNDKVFHGYLCIISPHFCFLLWHGTHFQSLESQKVLKKTSLCSDIQKWFQVLDNSLPLPAPPPSSEILCSVLINWLLLISSTNDQSINPWRIICA